MTDAELAHFLDKVADRVTPPTDMLLVRLAAKRLRERDEHGKWSEPVRGGSGSAH